MTRATRGGAERAGFGLCTGVRGASGNGGRGSGDRARPFWRAQPLEGRGSCRSRNDLAVVAFGPPLRGRARPSGDLAAPSAACAAEALDGAQEKRGVSGG